MPIPILTYHQIDIPPHVSSPFRGLSVAPSNFRQHMAWLKRLGWTGLSMRALKPYLCGDKTGRVFGITFDDGYRNIYANALPVLEELGFTATCYFVSRQIGGFNAWDSSLGIPHSPCMSKAEVLDWARCGHEVGAHTLDHVHLTAVSPGEARRQIICVRFELEDMLGGGVDAFCYPYGEVTSDIRCMVADAGYTSATTIRRGRARITDDPLLLPRRSVRCTDGPLNVLRKCFLGGSSRS